MSTIEAIEDAVEQLGKNDLATFREWFSSFEAAHWDAQIERDIVGGKLNQLADDAIAEFRSGNTREL